ncbi:HIV Tat-specific factor 1, partial [Entomortierella lignicola]
HNPEGVVSVRFKEKESAELCVRLMSGRYFAGQKVVAEIYDGHTRYEAQKSKEELEEEEKQRLDRYAKWLETEEQNSKKDKDDKAVKIATDAPTP